MVENIKWEAGNLAQKKRRGKKRGEEREEGKTVTRISVINMLIQLNI